MINNDNIYYIDFEVTVSDFIIRNKIWDWEKFNRTVGNQLVKKILYI